MKVEVSSCGRRTAAVTALGFEVGNARAPALRSQAACSTSNGIGLLEMFHSRNIVRDDRDASGVVDASNQITMMSIFTDDLLSSRSNIRNKSTFRERGRLRSRVTAARGDSLGRCIGANSLTRRVHIQNVGRFGYLDLRPSNLSIYLDLPADRNRPSFLTSKWSVKSTVYSPFTQKSHQLWKIGLNALRKTFRLVNAESSPAPRPRDTTRRLLCDRHKNGEDCSLHRPRRPDRAAAAPARLRRRPPRYYLSTRHRRPALIFSLVD
ncbi:hypothetical protein EVAR_29425_1 [Eumeta japonica]|uniref:Uncharacterized protein n=1 Tax=Eumeta variegata TaxID=151549 RepID=A0A4C1VU83_EUMVA|nr:hypothetical protein EVAR_29425_1 [Eumeta japonica]